MPLAKINQPKMFLETALSFTDPREVFREAIQDSLDAGAKKIIIDVILEDTAMGQSVKIIIEDDGTGLPPEKISNFMDLADSTKKEGETIGYLGVGTAPYWNSERVTLETWVEAKKYISVVEKPYATLFQNQLFTYSEPEMVSNIEGIQHGTRVTIEGYLKNSGENFIDHYSHPAVRDYILWKTVFGSIICQFEVIENPPRLYLRTYDSDEKTLQKEFRFQIKDGYEEIRFGHVFPEADVTSKEELKKLAEEARDSRWEEYACKRLYAQEVFVDGLDKPIQVLIWYEGDQCKKKINPMIRDGTKPSSSVRGMMYKVQDRYGFIVCKDYIPIQYANNWIQGKGSYTKYHAFINYNGFSLTSNRSSIDNTNPNVIKKIKDKLNEILDEIQKKKEFKDFLDLRVVADNERSAITEDLEFARRLKKCKSRKSVVLGNVRYYEPHFEAEAALLFDGILQTYPDCIHYEILDYNTADGIDFLVREQPGIPIENDNTVGYTELKHNLDKEKLNHSFSKLRNIVIYDKRGLKIGDVIVDLSGKKLMLQKVSGDLVLADYLGEVGHSVKLFVMKDFLESKGLAMS
jgi:hypothetical protein